MMTIPLISEAASDSMLTSLRRLSRESHLDGLRYAEWVVSNYGDRAGEPSLTILRERIAEIEANPNWPDKSIGVTQ